MCSCTKDSDIYFWSDTDRRKMVKSDYLRVLLHKSVVRQVYTFENRAIHTIPERTRSCACILVDHEVYPYKLVDIFLIPNIPWIYTYIPTGICMEPEIIQSIFHRTGVNKLSDFTRMKLRYLSVLKRE